MTAKQLQACSQGSGEPFAAGTLLVRRDEGLIGGFPHLGRHARYSKGLQRLAKAADQLSIGFTVAPGVEMTTRAAKGAQAVAFERQG